MTGSVFVAEALRSPDSPVLITPRMACVDPLADEFDEFVRSRSTSLLRAAYLLTGDQHLAEDLVQSALARTHRSWKTLHRSGNAEAYTRKVMYHLQVSWWRRGKVAESMPGEIPEPRSSGSNGDVADGLALRLTLHQALARLTPKQRAVLVLRFYEDRSEAEAAAILELNIGTIKSQTVKALNRLRVVAPELAELYVMKGQTR
jgi:RNA polymerase sigma-70 factor (sigma-E family)